MVQFNDNCFHVLENAGSFLQQDFYTVDSPALRCSNFVSLNNTPDYRLCPMLCVFLRPLVLSCPPEHCESLIYLANTWNTLHLLSCVSLMTIPEMAGHQPVKYTLQWSTADDNPESQEMFEDQLAQLLFWEVMDLITVRCVSKKGTEQNNSRGVIWRKSYLKLRGSAWDVWRTRKKSLISCCDPLWQRGFTVECCGGREVGTLRMSVTRKITAGKSLAGVICMACLQKAQGVPQSSEETGYTTEN